MWQDRMLTVVNDVLPGSELGTICTLKAKNLKNETFSIKNQVFPALVKPVQLHDTEHYVSQSQYRAGKT